MATTGCLFCLMPVILNFSSNSKPMFYASATVRTVPDTFCACVIIC